MDEHSGTTPKQQSEHKHSRHPHERSHSPRPRKQNPIKRFLSVLGPGLITGAADDDPSGIATYSIAGASLGFATLWTALVTLPLMSVVQYLCAKIGMVSGCLLYTSDAADERSSVDLGGR